MADIYKSSEEAGQQVRRLGQAYKPGSVFKERTGVDYAPGEYDVAGLIKREDIDTSMAPSERRSAIRPYNPSEEEQAFLAGLSAPAEPEAQAPAAKPRSNAPPLPEKFQYAQNIADLIVRGGQTAYSNTKLGAAVVTGDVLEKAGLMAEEMNRPEAKQPEELKRVKGAFKELGEKGDEAEGFWQTAGVVGEILFEAGKQAVTNPMGLVYLTSEQLGNMVPGILGRLAGAKSGAIVGGVSTAGNPIGVTAGAVVGGFAGGTAGGATTEMGAAFMEITGKALQDMKVPPTEANLRALLSDQEFVTKALEQARTKGVTTAAIDAAFNTAGGKVSSGAKSAAVKQAAKEGGDATQIANRAKEILDQRSITQVAGRQVAAGAISTAGDGLSEAGGQKAAYGKVDLGEVGLEIVGGLGGSILEVPAAAREWASSEPKGGAPASTPAPGNTQVPGGTQGTAEGTQNQPAATRFAMPAEEFNKTLQSVQGQRSLAALYAVADEESRAVLEQVVERANVPIDIFTLSQTKGMRQQGQNLIATNGQFVSSFFDAANEFLANNPADQDGPRMTVRDRLANNQLNAQQEANDAAPLDREDAQLEFAIAGLDPAQQEAIRNKYKSAGTGELVAGPGESNQEGGPTREQLNAGFDRAVRNLANMPEAARQAAARSGYESMLRYGYTEEEANQRFGAFLNPENTESNSGNSGIEVTEGQVEEITAAPAPTDTTAVPNVSERLQAFRSIIPNLLKVDQERGIPTTEADYAPGNLTPGLYELAKAFGVKLTGFRYVGKNPEVAKKMALRNGASTPDGIAINSASRDQFMTIFGHEVYHELKKRFPEEAAALEAAVMQYVNGDGAKTMRAKLESIGYPDGKITEEVVADIMGLMFGDPQFWQQLGEKQPTVLQRVLNIIDNLIQRFTALSKRKTELQGYITDMTAVRNMMAEFAARGLDQQTETTQQETVQETQEEIDSGDPIDQINELAKAGKKMEAAKVFRAANLYQQLGVSFNDFYAEAAGQTTTKPAAPAMTDAVRSEMERRYRELAASTADMTAFDQDRALARYAKDLAEYGFSDNEIADILQGEADVIDSATLKSKKVKFGYNPADRNVGSTVKASSDNPNVFEGTKEVSKPEEQATNPKKLTPKEKAALTRERNEALLNGQYSDKNAAEAMRIKDKITSSEVVSRALVDGEPVAVLYKTNSAKKPYVRFDINKDGTFRMSHGPDPKGLFKKLPDGAEVVEPVRGIDPLAAQGSMDLTENRALENKFMAEAQKIMLQQFTKTSAAETLAELREQIDAEFARQKPFFKYRKPKDPAQYIYDQFEMVQPGPGQTKVGFDKLSGERVETEKKGSKGYLAALSRAVTAAQQGDVIARAGLMKVHAAKIEDALLDLRIRMAQSGLSDTAIDRIVQPHLDSIRAFRENDDPKKMVSALDALAERVRNLDNLPPEERTAEMEAIAKAANNPEIAALIEMQDLIESDDPLDMPKGRDIETLPLDDPDYSDRRRAAAGAILEAKQNKTSPMMMLRRESQKADPEFFFSDLRAEMAAQGMEVSAIDREVAQWPAARYNLEYWVNKHMGTMGAYNARVAWYESHNQLMNIYKNDAAMRDQYTQELTPEEVAFIDSMRKQEDQARNRLKESMKRVPVYSTDGTKTNEFRPFDDPQSAFPHALFNQYTLNEMRDIDSPSISPEQRRVLRMVSGGRPSLLPGIWLNDLSQAINARKDLIPQIMDGLTKEEQAAFKEYQARLNTALANPVQMSDRRTYVAQLDQLRDLDPSLYRQFSNQIAYANIKAIPEILHHARVMSAISRTAADNKQRNAALTAYLDQMYHNDEMRSTSLNAAADAFNRIAEGEQTVVDEEDVTALIQMLTRQGEPVPSRERAREMVLFEKLAAAAADKAASYIPGTEELADPSADPESTAGLSGDIQYKRGRFSGVTAAIAVEEHVLSITENWPSQPNVTVRQNIDQIEDPDVRARLLERNPSGQFAGAIDPETGAVYLFSDYMNDLADAEFVLFHELYGHWGLRAFLGDKINAFLENQYRLNKKIKAEADRQYQEALGTDSPMSRLESVEEAISDAAAKGEPSLFRQLVGQLVAWLRKHNMEGVADWLDSSGSSEMAYVLAAARKAVREGTMSPMNGAPSEVLYSRQRRPVELFAIRDGKTNAYARLNPMLGSWTVFTIADPQTGDFHATSVDSFADAAAILKKFGSISKSEERSTRQEVDPAKWHDIPDFSDVTGWNKFVRNKLIRHQNGYLPIFEVANYLKSKGVENTVVDDLIKYESRAGYLIDQVNKEYVLPIMNMLKVIGDKGGTVQDVDRFLLARHAKERNGLVDFLTSGKNKRGSGMDSTVAADLLSTNNNGKWDAYTSELDAIGQMMDKISEFKLNYMLQSGQINKLQFETLSRYEHYVNLSGNEEMKADTYDKKILGNRAFVIKGRELQRAAGRGTEPVDIIENTLNALTSSLLRGQQNRVLQSILDMFEQSPNPDFMQVQPQKERKMINVERMNFDKKILRSIGDTPIAQSGKKLLKDLQERVQANEMTEEEALGELARRINLAEAQRSITPQEAQTAIKRLNDSVIDTARLSPDGYVSMVEDNTLISDDNVVVAKVDGAPVYMQFKPRGTEFVKALTGMNGDNAGDFLKAVGAWNRFFGQLLTSWNPAWILPNMLLDTQTLYSNSAADPRVGPALAKKMVAEMPKAVHAAWRYTIEQQGRNNNSAWGRRLARSAEKKPMNPEWKALITRYLKDGGGTYFMDRKNLDQTLEKLSRVMNGPVGALQKSEDFVEGLTNLMELLGDPSELGPRLAAYKVLTEAGWSHQDAVRYGKEVTVNFNMRGAEAWMRNLYVFANPSIQGTKRQFQDYSRSDKGIGRFLPSNGFAAVAIQFMVLGVLSNIIGRAIGGEDEDREGMDVFDRVPQGKRNSSFIFAPDTYGGSIPIAHGWRAFFAAGVHFWDAAMGKVKPEVAAQRTAAAAADTLLPFGSAADASNPAVWGAKTFSPTPFVPILELGFNENRNGAPIYKKADSLSGNNESNAFMNYDSVNPITVGAMRSLAAIGASGNPRYSAGFIDINPGVVEHLFKSVLPGLPTDVYNLSGYAANQMMGRNTKAANIPLADRFNAKPTENFDVGAMRRISESVNQKWSELQARDTDNARRAQILREHPNIGAMRALVQSTDQEVRRISQNLRVLETDPGYTEAQKVELRNKAEADKKVRFNRVVKQALKSGFRDEVLDAKMGGTLGKVFEKIRE